jgi:FMN-dependent NADH-azoreductase
MTTLLRIDASPLPESASISRPLTAEFVRRWKQAHPGGHVVTRDLAASPPPTITAEWIGAMSTPENDRSEAHREILALSDQLIAELTEADEYVFGIPMHNFSVASSFRLWIDQVVRAGKTFSYASGSPQGLLQGKKAFIINASGGVYAAGTPMAAYNFVEPYVRTIFGFIGITDVHFLTAGGASAIHSGKSDRQSFLDSHVQAIKACFGTEAGASAE